MTRKWLGPSLLVLALIATAFVFPRLPERIPTHWDFSGEVDSYGPRFPAAFLPVFIGLALWIVLPVLRKVDPRKRNYDKFDETFWLLLNLLTFFFLLLHGVTLAAALGGDIDVSRAMIGGIGLMFAALGNYLPRLRSNWWMGIRTPWTLESEEVWRRTHRVGGRTFVIGGILAAAFALTLPDRLANPAAFAALMLAGLTPVVYSYLIWRKQ